MLYPLLILGLASPGKNIFHSLNSHHFIWSLHLAVLRTPICVSLIHCTIDIDLSLLELSKYNSTFISSSGVILEGGALSWYSACSFLPQYFGTFFSIFFWETFIQVFVYGQERPAKPSCSTNQPRFRRTFAVKLIRPWSLRFSRCRFYPLILVLLQACQWMFSFLKVLWRQLNQYLLLILWISLLFPIHYLYIFLLACPVSLCFCWFYCRFGFSFFYSCGLSCFEVVLIVNRNQLYSFWL